ncbi:MULTISPECIES: hypothetical protein [Bacillus]|nr:MULTISPECIES: hypothetical protein [Bacillus]AMK71531.1 hypothetical protein AWV81_05090 [Bacillus subtilis subsp. natto]AOR97328.1 hypothetical protein BSBS38_01047 [Bacillus subtilis]AOS67110.1 hypothetical protein A4A60_05335 [Bacillus subtilis]API41231.1 hypothetical protein BSR08_01270 [Bacillus subtilis]API95711.1 hypothetical protein BKP58_07235 [Bacillus subtilis]
MSTRMVQLTEPETGNFYMIPVERIVLITERDDHVEVRIESSSSNFSIKVRETYEEVQNLIRPNGVQIFK